MLFVLLVFGLNSLETLSQKSEVDRRRANGAKYDSQWKARSASPLVIRNQLKRALKVQNIVAIITLFQSLTGCYAWTQGDALRACPWLSHAALWR